MTIYPMIFANYAKNACQDQSTSGKGERLWFTPSADTISQTPPMLIIITENGLIVQYADRFQQMGFDGKFTWQRDRDAGMNIIAYDNNIYFRGYDGDLHAVDSRNQPVLSDFFIPTSTDRGGFNMVLPKGENRMLVQTYNRAPEVEKGEPPIQDDYNLVLMGDGNWEWLLEFKGNSLPALVTADARKVILLNNESQVLIYDSDSGERQGSFEIEGCWFLKASLDCHDNLVILSTSVEKEKKLSSYSLSGTMIWEYMLPSGEAGMPDQPPAVDKDNRVYFISNNFVNAIDKGELSWQYPILDAQYFQYITVLGDNSILVASANMLYHLSQSGEVLFSNLISPDEQITTPPVVDAKGRIYLGTAAGIYCLK